ncbi:sensor histidine kinase [Spirochaeta lutea]|uniref:Histidine kinase n=1 Tax=Spirochaeta lutea TaxID=1480694 RepID=A0A098QT98_9SPIO|nr:histidine kinase [Spirochaeta lutea]KGE70924.1 histidine kinase [Spirochaeta lutea]
MRQTLRTRLIFYMVLSLSVVVFSLSFILLLSLQFQGILQDQFSTESYLQQLQTEVHGVRQPFLQYVTSRSSTALAELLARQQTILGVLPPALPRSGDSLLLAQREVYSLIRGYLGMIEEGIQLKRARAIQEYTQLYEDSEALNELILRRIDAMSLTGLRNRIADYGRLMEAFRQLQVWNLLVVIFSVLSALLWMLGAINRLTEPMHRLAVAAGELSAGNFEGPDIQVSALPEVATVISAFNTMRRDISQYIAEIERRKAVEKGYLAEKLRNLNMEHLLKRMELYTMQAQMNPHFLFNTLNTGVQLAILEEADKTAEFMEKLAHFFRRNMRQQELFVPLGQELEGLKAYLEILAIRFPTTLELRLDTDDSLADRVSIPALILQPLVENSVVHAFQDIQGRACITITVRENRGLVELVVADNGKGMDQNTARSLVARNTRRERGYGSKVMGLENVIQRLYFFYPQNQDCVTIESEPYKGTTVTIRINPQEEPCIPS